MPDSEAKPAKPVKEKSLMVMTTLRMKATDLKLFKDAAEERGMSLSAFFRWSALEHLKKLNS